MAGESNTHSVPSQERDQNVRGPVAHCCECARLDTKAYERSQVISAAVDLASYDPEKSTEAQRKLNEGAVAVLQRIFDTELLPKGF